MPSVALDSTQCTRNSRTNKTSLRNSGINNKTSTIGRITDTKEDVLEEDKIMDGGGPDMKPSGVQQTRINRIKYDETGM